MMYYYLKGIIKAWPDHPYIPNVGDVSTIVISVIKGYRWRLSLLSISCCIEFDKV